MLHRPYTIRVAEERDEPEIAALVVAGFLDKFRPAFGRRLGASLQIMEHWISLEHARGGITSLVIEEPEGVAASVGVRLSKSEEAEISGELWSVFREHMGILRSLWSTMLLSYPHYAYDPSEAYVERLAVFPEHRRSGMGRALMQRAEELGNEENKKNVGLHVSADNLPARKLYEGTGYAEVSRQRSMLNSRFMGVREWLYLSKPL